ncbi:Qin prophage [Escherichia coli]
MAQVAIFKQIFDKVRNNLNYHWFYSELKRHNVSHYIYYLATENIHLVLENDNTVLIKGQGKVVNVRFSKNKCLIEATLGNDSNLLIVFYVQIMPDDFVMQLHRF